MELSSRGAVSNKKIIIGYSNEILFIVHHLNLSNTIYIYKRQREKRKKKNEMIVILKKYSYIIKIN